MLDWRDAGSDLETGHYTAVRRRCLSVQTEGVVGVRVIWRRG